MITCKNEFFVYSAMYMRLKEVGHDILCQHETKETCSCGLTNMLVPAKRWIERSAVYHGLVPRVKEDKRTIKGFKTKKRMPCQRLKKKKGKR